MDTQFFEVVSTQQMGLDFEKSSARFAQDNGLSCEEYLSVINKWSQWDPDVLDIMERISTLTRKKIAQVLEADSALAVGAIVFRKYEPAAQTGFNPAKTFPTHPHQDISYARFPGSQKFRATTWFPLVLQNGDTLALAKGSHKQGIKNVVDFLRRPAEEHIEPAPKCEEVIDDIALGDCIVFDARTWHRSTEMVAKEGETSLRIAIGIQWITPGGLDGLSPGVYHRWPDSDQPVQADVDRMRANNVFGMDTAGYFLKNALVKLNELKYQRATPGETTGEVVQPGLSRDSVSTLKLAVLFSNDDDSEVKTVLHAAGCDVEKAQTALKRYVLLRKAATLHYGEVQGTKIFGPLYDFVIKPVLGM